LWKLHPREEGVSHHRADTSFSTIGELGSPPCGSSYLNRAVVITMPLMLMVEMTSHKVVRMIAVGNRFMPAVWAVPVGGFVTAAGASSIAFRRIGGVHFELVLIHMIAMHIVHVAVVKEALMPFVHESRMAALISMLMRVSLMNFVTHVSVLLCSAMLNLSRRSQKSRKSVAGSGSRNAVA
jgi:hypothetical protein